MPLSRTIQLPIDEDNCLDFLKQLDNDELFAFDNAIRMEIETRVLIYLENRNNDE